ncbi:hypothetical protein AC1031_018825 [Aphanomyces cochlioides]|nr:hypothetical protein AC1031_018825 [Aphanomyces cochlioides]
MQPPELAAAEMLHLEDVSTKQEELLRRLLRLQPDIRRFDIVPEDLPYEEAKRNVEDISKRMGDIGSADVTHPDPAIERALREEYFKLEQDIGALMRTDKYKAEEERREREWEDENREENEKALKAIRRMMPSMSR